MKRVGQLLPAIATWPNVMAAWRRAAAGKRGKRQARRFAEAATENVNQLAAELADLSWRPGPYRRSVIRDPKTRVIHAAPFRDRVAHHALLNVAGPGFERAAMDHSYACRVGKGSRAAVEHAARCSRRFRHFLKLDIRRFFDSVPHAVLLQLLRRRFKDAGFLTLMERIVRSHSTAPGRGLPIGTLTSQYLANFCLDGLDHHILQQLAPRAYVRYMDDFVLWHDDPGQLRRARDGIVSWLAAERGLELKEPGAPRPVDDGLPFLGYRILPGRILLGQRARRRFRRRLSELESAHAAGRVNSAEEQRRGDALLAFVRVAECRRWRQRLLHPEP